jgi:NAD(P)-dependent dehydrogenase (short-subunit alcohol dehydrogenase family)
VLLHELPEESWDRVIDINLKGVWLCMKYELVQMLTQGAGAIVNTASIMGLVGSWSRSGAYVASKHGVVGLTKTAALEYATWPKSRVDTGGEFIADPTGRFLDDARATIAIGSLP